MHPGTKLVPEASLTPQTTRFPNSDAPWSFTGDAAEHQLRLYQKDCRGQVPTRADLDRAVALGLDPGWAFSRMGWDPPPGACWGAYHAARADALGRYERALQTAYREHARTREATPAESWGEYFRATREARREFFHAVADALADALGLEPAPADHPTD